MKKIGSKKRWLLISPWLFFIALLPSPVFAKVIGGIGLLIEKYELGAYQSYMVERFSLNPLSDTNVGSMINSMANSIFWLTKMAAKTFDAGLEMLYGLDAIDRLTDTFSGVSGTLWHNLFATFAIMFFVIAVIQIFIEFFAKKNGNAAGRKAITLFLVVGISMGWFLHSADYTRMINKWSAEAQAFVMKSGLSFVSKEEIQLGNELDGSLALIRNQFFTQAVMNPYLLMNYGIIDQKGIGQERIDALLKNDLTKEGYEKANKYIDDHEADNYYVSVDAAGYKLAISCLSIVGVLMIGIPLMLIALVNFLLQMVALGIMVILPISFILSFLPKFAHSGWFALGRLLGVFCLKMFVGFVILLMFIAMTTVQILIPATDAGTYLLQLIVSSILIIMIIKYRDKIIQFVTAGMVVSADGGVTKGALEKGKDASEFMMDKVEKLKYVKGMWDSKRLDWSQKGQKASDWMSERLQKVKYKKGMWDANRLEAAGRTAQTEDSVNNEKRIPEEEKKTGQEEGRQPQVDDMQAPPDEKTMKVEALETAILDAEEGNTNEEERQPQVDELEAPPDEKTMKTETLQTAILDAEEGNTNDEERHPQADGMEVPPDEKTMKTETLQTAILDAEEGNTNDEERHSQADDMEIPTDEKMLASAPRQSTVQDREAEVQSVNESERLPQEQEAVPEEEKKAVVRNVRDLGRITIPKEFRNALNIQDGDSLEIFVDDDKVILGKAAQPREQGETFQEERVPQPSVRKKENQPQKEDIHIQQVEEGIKATETTAVRHERQEERTGQKDNKERPDDK